VVVTLGSCANDNSQGGSCIGLSDGMEEAFESVAILSSGESFL
jgi:hypothetical protein